MNHLLANKEKHQIIFFILVMWSSSEVTMQLTLVTMASAVEYLRELNKAAEVDIENSKPLKWYLRSTELVFKQVKSTS
jgi:hypothetical protein